MRNDHRKFAFIRDFNEINSDLIMIDNNLNK